MSTIDLSALTPETFFIPNPEVPHEIPIDLVSLLLARAHGILMLLSSDAEARLADGDAVEPIYIANAIDAVDGLLRQVDAVFMHCLIKGSE
ncbi:hypothetical protein BH20PSE1_BH20PSE1_01550 [soil metagenome]